jgi:cell division protein FtsL
MTRRRGRDGDETPRVVRGAWTTPAVVVRRPDGSVVEPGSAGERAPDRDAASEPEPQRGGGGRPRVRPRRIPGAPGAVLLVPTLSQAGDVAEGRRLRRNSGPPASVSPLPPRPPVPEADDPSADASGDASPQPPLALVGDALRRARGRGRDAARGGGPGAGPTGRVVQALRGVGPRRLLPVDPEERAERLARLRRACVGVAAAVVACVMAYTVFPVRTALNLWDAEDRARERQAAFERENEILEDEIADLQSDERIEVEAREQGMVLPGEESYGIMPAPAPVPGSSTSTTASSSTSTTTPGG